MKELIIKTQAEADALVENNVLYFDGSIIFKCSIKVGYSIRSGGYIYSNGSIRSDGDIHSDGYIYSNGDIYSGGYIYSNGSIRSDGDIKAGGYIFSSVFEISCKFIVTRTLPFWRSYYAAMPPLTKYAASILNTSKCWDTLRQEIMPDAEPICAWDGWHPIIRAQLRMYFGFSTQETLPETYHA